MSASRQDPGSMRDRVLDAIDPEGQVRQHLDAARSLTAHPALQEVLKARKLDLALVERTATYNHLLDVTARATEGFSVLGWAASSHMPISAYEAALQALDAGDSDRAELIIAESWDDRTTLRRIVQLVGRLGLPDHELNKPFTLRAELLLKAVDHHIAGAFEASVPILLAQCEGLVADVAGGMFFSQGSRKADIVSAASIATLDEALPVVRALFSRGMDYSAATGELRRHGILHGRELGYHTRLNSLKCFVLLQALIEWAGPLIADKAERRRVVGETRWAGSDEFDERGRRRDRREFADTCDALQFLAAAHMGWYSPETGYQRRVLDMVATSTPGRQLKRAPGISMHISDDNQSWWAWRQTVTGWVFGVAGIGGPPSDLFYDGPRPPASGPADKSAIWNDVASANWSSR